MVDIRRFALLPGPDGKPAGATKLCLQLQPPESIKKALQELLSRAVSAELVIKLEFKERLFTLDG